MIRRLSLFLILFLANTSTNAQILFQGDWSNFRNYFYSDKTGWKNLKADSNGQPTGNENWYDIMSYYHSKRVGNTWETNSSFEKDRISIAFDPTSPKGGYVAKFIVKSGDHRDQDYSGERSEMGTMLGPKANKFYVTKTSGREVYAISIKVPENWESPKKDPKNGNIWGIFLQLHSPNIYDSPPALDLSVDSSYALRMNSGELYEFVTNAKTGVKTMKKKDCVRYNLNDGGLRKGQWVQFLMDVNWSETNTGYVKLYRRDKDETNFKLALKLTGIPTLQTSKYVKTDLSSCPACRYKENTGHYWRVGFYRSTSDNLTNTLSLGSIVRGTNLNEAAIAAFGSTGNIPQ